MKQKGNISETENAIEELFESENLPDPSQQVPAELKKFHLNPSQIALELEKQRQVSGLDRRQFTRVDVGDKKLEVKFLNGMQFARQYVENISIGGLFVKTEASFNMGDRIPIEFSVPAPDGSGIKSFKLQGKVCRIINGGVSLEFIHLSSDVRNDLEQYVQSILPSGALLHTPKAKLATIENLERLREQKLQNASKRRDLAGRIGLVVILLLINGFLVRQTIEIEKESNRQTQKTEKVSLGTREVYPQEIQAVEFTGNQFQFLLTNGEQVTLSANDASLDQLPYNLSQTVNLLKTIPPVEVPRISKNAPTLIQVH